MRYASAVIVEVIGSLVPDLGTVVAFVVIAWVIYAAINVLNVAYHTKSNSMN
jgi:large-conductance mechanosensitive channel